MNKRDQNIDAIKGIGIIMVVLNHHWNVTPVIEWIHSFHMPLFFIISGLLYKAKEITYSEYVVHKFCSLMLPFYFYSIATIIWQLFELLIFQTTVDIRATVLNTITTYGEGFLWFLPTLFFASLFFEALRRNGSTKSLWIEMAIVGLVGVICSYAKEQIKSMPRTSDVELMIFLLQYFGRICLGIFFMYVGLVLRDKQACLKDHTIKAIMLLFLGIVSLLSYQYTGLEMKAGITGNPIIFLLTTLSGSFFVINFGMFFRLGRNKLLTFLGRNSLDVMALHMLFPIEIAYFVLGIAKLYLMLNKYIYVSLAIVIEMIIICWTICWINKLRKYLH